MFQRSRVKMAFRLTGSVYQRLGFLLNGSKSRGMSMYREAAGRNPLARVLHQKKDSLCRQRVPCSMASYCSVASASVESTAQQPLAQQSQERLSLADDGQSLTVAWKDGSVSRFHSVWLRHNCHCSVCRQEHSSQRLIDPAAVSPQIQISDARLTGADLEIQWKGEGQHVGKIPMNHLQQNCYEAEALRDRREAVKVEEPVKTLPEVNYTDLISSETEVLRWLRQINEAGVSLLKGVPTQEDMLRKVAERIGPIDDLIYGELFDVISRPKPINVAYSSVELGFHMDLIYYESPGGLSILHCMKFDECVEGGENLFLDVFQVAEEFRETNPDHFSTLVKIPASFQKIHYDRDNPVEMKYQKPHIILNQYQEIVCVNWAPPFEGPLAVQQDEVMPYYEAYEAFAKAVKFSPHVIEYRLKPGDLVTFNNRRFLHARNSFELNGGVRHLRGCNINIDHFKNAVTVYSRLHGMGEPTKRVGNQDWF